MADKARRVAIVGSGTIGLSFAALHLQRNPLCVVKIFDTRPDLQEYVEAKLPGYLAEKDLKSCKNRLTITRGLDEALKGANIVQEQGPENLEWKAKLWPQVEKLAKKDAMLWSSTSGIPASAQSREMDDKSRLMVVHPFNPPHLMPLLEVVPSPETKQEAIDRTLEYWQALGRTPVVVRKECTGFVANRLAFALFREACSLVNQGIVSVEDLDAIVTSSMGPRWTVSGPIKAYHTGGGEGGLSAFMDKIGATIQDCWNVSEEDIQKGNIKVGEKWQDELCRQSEEAYGVVDAKARDEMMRKVLDAVGKQ